MEYLSAVFVIIIPCQLQGLVYFIEVQYIVIAMIRNQFLCLLSVLILVLDVVLLQKNV